MHNKRIKMKTLAAIALFFGVNFVYSQKGTLEEVNYLTNRCYVNVWITGKIFDASSREPLANATIGVKGTNLYCIADSNGQYALNILPILDTVKTFDLVGYYINYQSFVITIKEKVTKNIIVDIALKERPTAGCPEVILSKEELRKLKKQRK